MRDQRTQLIEEIAWVTRKAYDGCVTSGNRFNATTINQFSLNVTIKNISNFFYHPQYGAISHLLFGNLRT
jgi:hypothetical protein